MSLKRIRLHIKAKCKIHENVGHKEHSTRSLQPHSLFVNLPQILTSPSPPTATLLHRATRALAEVKKSGVNCIASKHICNTIVYFDLLSSNINNNRAIYRFFLHSARRILYINFISVVLRPVFRSWPLLSQSFEITDTVGLVGSSGRVIRR